MDASRNQVSLAAIIANIELEEDKFTRLTLKAMHLFHPIRSSSKNVSSILATQFLNTALS